MGRRRHLLHVGKVTQVRNPGNCGELFVDAIGRYSQAGCTWMGVQGASGQLELVAVGRLTSVRCQDKCGCVPQS